MTVKFTAMNFCRALFGWRGVRHGFGCRIGVTMFLVGCELSAASYLQVRCRHSPLASFATALNTRRVIVELINTGSELMLGRVLNTHQQWLCRQLADLGYTVSRQIAVPDTGVALTVAIAFARDSVVGVLRSGMRHIDRVSGALMVLMGAYVAWYGIFSLRVRNDPRAAAGPVDLVEDWSGRATQLVSDVGATRLGLTLVAITAALIGVSRVLAGRRPGVPR